MIWCGVAFLFSGLASACLPNDTVYAYVVASSLGFIYLPLLFIFSPSGISIYTVLLD